jgi:hypothetical protein
MIAAIQKEILPAILPNPAYTNTSTRLEPCEFERLLVRAMEVLTERARVATAGQNRK